MKLIGGEVSVYQCDGCDKRIENREGGIPDGWVYSTPTNKELPYGHYCSECYEVIRHDILHPKPRPTLFSLIKMLIHIRRLEKLLETEGYERYSTDSEVIYCKKLVNIWNPSTN